MSKLIEQLQDLYELFLKIYFPLTGGLSIKLGVMIRRKEGLIFKLVSGLLTGIGSAMVFGHFFIENLPYDYATICIALTVMLSEKVGIWIMEKFNIDRFLKSVADTLTDILLRRKK